MTTGRDAGWEDIQRQIEYEKSLVHAMLARASYEEESIIIAARGADYYSIFEWQEPAIKFEMPNNYRLIADEADQFARYPSGLKAVAFEKNDGTNLIIAFPGMDWSARQVTGPAHAMAIDGDIVGLLGLLPVGERSETSVRQTGKAQEFVYGARRLDPQIQDALDYAGRLKEKYEARGYTVEVTGYEMGGGLAQIVSHAYGLPGRAFDPMGAKNVIDSRHYQEWEQEHGIIHNEIPGLHSPPDFTNYVVNGSPISGRTGAHIGETVAITGMGGRDPGDYANYAFGKALNIGSNFVKGVGTSAAMEVGGHLADFNKYGKEGIDRIVRVFENAVQTNHLQQWGQEPPDAPKAERPMAQEATTSSPPTRRDWPRYQPPNDLRDEAHPGHYTYTTALAEVRRSESVRHVSSGHFGECLAAGLAVAAIEAKLPEISQVEHEGGSVAAVYRFGPQPPRRAEVDAREATETPMEQHSVRYLAACSPHYVSKAPAAQRTREDGEALERLSPQSQAMFCRAREGAPAHISDAVVIQAVLAANREEIDTADKMGGISMFNNQLLIQGKTPGFYAAVDVTETMPSLQESVAQVNTLERQREQERQLAQQKEQDDPSRGGPKMG